MNGEPVANQHLVEAVRPRTGQAVGSQRSRTSPTTCTTGKADASSAFHDSERGRVNGRACVSTRPEPLSQLTAVGKPVAQPLSVELIEDARVALGA